jgi:outer membrane protein assembly factor BamB
MLPAFARRFPLAALFVGVAFLGSLRADDWPQFGGPNRDFRSAASSLSSTNSTGPTPWSIELGDGDAAPIHYGGNLYVASAAFADEGNEALQVQCLKANSGDIVWSQILEERSYVSQDISDAYPVRPMASLIAAKGLIVSVSFGGCVACMDAKNGIKRWQIDLVSDFQATPIQYGWSSSPWSDGSKVVVACGSSDAMLIALDLESGKVAWKAGHGEAAYGSLSTMENGDGSTTVCYVGRDEMIGVRSTDGEVLWTYPLPRQGLTNAVTPIACGQGKWLIAGQGFEGSRLFETRSVNGNWQVNEIWQSNKFNPFYCNWIADSKSKQAFGYNSSRLSSIDLESGNTKWQTRGWTDVNFAMAGSQVVGIRGDGFMTLSNLTDSGLVINSGARVVNDRVWAPPVVVEQIAYLRGRRSLSSVLLSKLPPLAEMPSGTMIDSMKAMYGERNEQIAALLENASTVAATFELRDYESLLQDRSIRFSEQEYRGLFDAMKSKTNTDLKIQIAEDWVRREPDSIVAFDQLTEFLKSTRANERLEQFTRNRYVELTFDVTVPSDTPIDTSIYVTGNAVAMGAWKSDGILLERLDDVHYRTRVQVPRGNLQYKLAMIRPDGTKSMEARADGRSTSNRRHRVTQPTTLSATVATWKTTAEK